VLTQKSTGKSVDFCVSTVLGFTAVQEAITVIQRSNISLCTSLSACAFDNF